MKRLILLMTCVCALVLGVNASAKTDAATSLASALKPVAAFKAEFHQTVVDEDGETLEEYSGDLSVKRPGKLFWKSKQPFAQTLVSDNKKIWFYDEDLKQVTIRNASVALTQTPALILSGDVTELKKKFAIQLVKQTDKQSSYVLTPLEKSGLFETLILTLENGVLAQLQIKDSLQQTTTISLYQVNSKASIKDSLFKFKIPKGAKVINDDKRKS